MGHDQSVDRLEEPVAQLLVVGDREEPPARNQPSRGEHGPSPCQHDAVGADEVDRRCQGRAPDQGSDPWIRLDLADRQEAQTACIGPGGQPGGRRKGRSAGVKTGQRVWTP